MSANFVQAFTRFPGGALSEDATLSNRCNTEVFIAGGAITAGDWVQWVNVAGTGALMCATVGESAASIVGGNLTCGVALESAVEGDLIEVVTRGFVLRASAQTDVTAGLVCGAGFAGNASGVAGQAQRLVVIDTSGAADTIPVPAQCGVALTAEGTLANGTTEAGFASFYVTCGR